MGSKAYRKHQERSGRRSLLRVAADEEARPADRVRAVEEERRKLRGVPLMFRRVN